MTSRQKVNSSVVKGFTIVELLIVIVVIAILAAISIVAYNGIQNRANDSTVQSDLANIAKKLELDKLDSANGGYPTTITALNTADIRATKGSYDTSYTLNFAYCATTTTGLNYALVGKSKSGTKYWISSVGGKGSYTTGNNSVGGQEACDLLSLTSGSTGFGTTGYNSNNSGWQSWVK